MGFCVCAISSKDMFCVQLRIAHECSLTATRAAIDDTLAVFYIWSDLKRPPRLPLGNNGIRRKSNVAIILGFAENCPLLLGRILLHIDVSVCKQRPVHRERVGGWGTKSVQYYSEWLPIANRVVASGAGKRGWSPKTACATISANAPAKLEMVSSLSHKTKYWWLQFRIQQFSLNCSKFKNLLDLNFILTSAFSTRKKCFLFTALTANFVSAYYPHLPGILSLYL